MHTTYVYKEGRWGLQREGMEMVKCEVHVFE